MSAQHTPGPWEAVELLDDSFEIRPVGSSAWLLRVRSAANPDEQERAEDVANVRLRAAAPDLLEALKRCKFDSLNMSLADLEACRAAIVKATGSA